MNPYPYNLECSQCRNLGRPTYKGCGSCNRGSNYMPAETQLQSGDGCVYYIQTLIPPIRRVLFHNPATIVFWADGTKTVVKAHGEEFDPEKGLAMAISKKALGTGYYPEIKKWTEKCHKKNEDDESSAWEELKKKLDKAMNKVADAMKETVNMADTIRSEITMSEEVWNNVLQRALIDADEDDAESDAYYKSVICPECIAKMEDE